MNDDQNTNDPDLMDPAQVPDEEIEDLQQTLSEEEPDEDSGATVEDDNKDEDLA